MQEAVPTGGAMAAVIGMDGEQIRKICQETEGRVLWRIITVLGRL